MRAIEFIIELDGSSTLPIPQEFVSQLPKFGNAHVIVLIEEDADDTPWHLVAYEQFLRHDSPEDSVYDSYR